jgi:lysophospholipase L1-like esterase
MFQVIPRACRQSIHFSSLSRISVMTSMINRRRFFSRSAAGLLAASTSTLVRSEAESQPDTSWHDVQEWGVEGKGWDDTERYFDRLPVRAKSVVRDEVWGLSRHSSGMLARFRTDATQIWADYGLSSPRLEMAHMPSTGVSGLDLYAETEDGRWHWVAVVKPSGQQTRTQIISGLDPGARNYALYLPLYNGTEHLKIGVPGGTRFEGLPPREEKPLVFYGTSITHGACASRPGMPHPAILGRRLQRPIINLGFSGNGRMEPEVGQLLAELDAAVFIIDCLPNMNGEQVAERTVPLVRQLHDARPQTPIVLVEDRTYSNAPFLAAQRRRNQESRTALRAAYQQVLEEPIKNVLYLAGDHLLGDDHDDTTDGSHPSDLGFYRHAEAFEPVLRQALRM